jgi:hypothetical protein
VPFDPDEVCDCGVALVLEIWTVECSVTVSGGEDTVFVRVVGLGSAGGAFVLVAVGDFVGEGVALAYHIISSLNRKSQ